MIKILLDIHSHVLPGVDDGAKDLEESVELLKMMRQQGITHVLATPHFYASRDGLDEYRARVGYAFGQLKAAADGASLPYVMLGCEVLYYNCIGRSESVYNFCLNGSDYLLLELSDNCIDDEFFKDIEDLRRNLGITPIIAHLERYHKFPNYKKLLKFLAENEIPAQINASSLFSREYSKTVNKLIKKQLVEFIGTDAHSVAKRPPMMQPALEAIKKRFGAEYSDEFISNSQKLLERIG